MIESPRFVIFALVSPYPGRPDQTRAFGGEANPWLSVVCGP